MIGVQFPIMNLFLPARHQQSLKIAGVRVSQLKSLLEADDRPPVTIRRGIPYKYHDMVRRCLARPTDPK